MSKADLSHQLSKAVNLENQQEEVTDTLVRQVDSMIKRDMSGNNELGPMVSYSKLYTYATP